MSAQPLLLERPAAAAPPVVLGLRDYQEAALRASEERFAAGITRQLWSMATGAGKTVTAAHAIGRGFSADRFDRALFVVHRDELASQASRQLAQVNPGLDIGLVKAERNDVFARVVVASSQTLERARRFAQYQQAIAGERLLIISDESHHDGPKTRRAAFLKELDPVLLLGMTATPNRGDKTGLDHLYEEIVFHIGIIDLIVMNRLSPMVGIAVETGTDISAVRTVAGEYVQSDLEAAVDTPARNAIIVERWREHAADRTRTVAFCVDVAHALHLRDAFREAGVSAETIIGSTPPEERARIFRDFHDGRLSVLTNCMVLTEGYDEPAIDCVIMARPTKSQGLYIQCAGRGARKHQGKASCLVLDFVDVTRDLSLASFPSLAGLDPNKVRQGGSSGSAKTAPLDLVGMVEEHERLTVQSERRVNLFSTSPFVWSDIDGVPVAKAASGGRYIVVLPSGDGFIPYDLRGQTIRALIDRPLDEETAMAVAEQHIPPVPYTRRMPELKQTKATPAQLDYVRFLTGQTPGKSATQADVSALIDNELARRALRVALAQAREGQPV